MPSTSVQIHSSRGIQRGRQNRRRKIRSAAAQRGRPAVERGAVEARHHRQSLPRPAAAEHRGRPLAGLLPSAARRCRTRRRWRSRRAAFTASAGMPCDSRYSAISSADSRSPAATASSTERGGRSPSITCRWRCASNSSISASHPGDAPSPARSGGSSSRQALDMPRAQRREVGLQAGLVARLGVAHGVEQQVGDLRHGRHHDDHRPLGVLLGGETRRHPHALGRAHAGAAEFHHQQPGIRRTIFNDALSRWTSCPHQLQDGLLHFVERQPVESR